MQTPQEMVEEATECYRAGDMNGFWGYVRELNTLGLRLGVLQRMFAQEGISFPVSPVPPLVTTQLPTNVA